jgi:hypothetical protein
MGQMTYKHICSEERLTFHIGKPGTSGHGGRNHWHYYPSGSMRTSDRFRLNPDPSTGTRGRDYLEVGDVIEVCGCTEEQNASILAIVFIVGYLSFMNNSGRLQMPEPLLE